jgi:hypothetical protein
MEKQLIETAILKRGHLLLCEIVSVNTITSVRADRRTNESELDSGVMQKI